MPIPSVKGDFGQGGGRACGGFGFCRRVPFSTAPLSCPHLMASRREERDYGALPSEQRSEPCVTVADSPTQPTGFNHVCSPSMFSLFLFHFISPRLCFSLPSSILLSLSLSAQVYWKHFSLVFDRRDRWKTNFRSDLSTPLVFDCFLLVNTIAPPCSYVCVCVVPVWFTFSPNL